jgi:hypothetical protein
MTRIDAFRRPAPPIRAHQTNLFEVASGLRSNMVALYDLAPRFSFDQPADGGARKPILEREFTFGGGRYRITMKPTRIKMPGGTEVDKYLGEREQIVEEVIRRLACKRDRLTLEPVVVRGKGAASGQYNVRFAFSLYEVREELRRVRHTFGLAEVVQSIELLNEVRIIIQDLDAKGSPLLSAPAFPVMGLRREDDKDGETFVTFNPLVADAIRSLSFQQVDYETLMKIRDPVARWLLKRLHIDIAATKQSVQRMSANEIRRDSGMAEWKKSRDMFGRVAKAVNVLVELGVVEGVEVRDVLERRKKVDVLFTMSATPDFNAKIHGSNRVLAENRRDFSRLTSGADPANAFIEASEDDAYRIRAGRTMAGGALAAVSE